MEPHYALSDPEFEKQFESAVLDPKFFSHEAHLRLAWIHVTKYGVERAIFKSEKARQTFVQPDLLAF